MPKDGSYPLKRATVATLELSYQLRDHVDYAREWHDRVMRISMHLGSLTDELAKIAQAWEREADRMPADDARGALLRACAADIRDIGANDHAG